MTSNFCLNDPNLKNHLQHILEHPADLQYNSFIISGNLLGANLALAQFLQKLKAKYPDKEIINLQGHGIISFIRSKPLELLLNFHKLHPNLICALFRDLKLSEWTKEEQDKFALFCKSLIKNGVQVLSSADIGLYNSALPPITPEMWSWYMSAREYTLKHNLITYTKDLTASLTLEQDKKRFKLFSRLFKSHHFGQLYPGILVQDEHLDFDEHMHTKLGLCWFGEFRPPCYIFPKAICPTCGKVKLIPYSCIASVLSGGHVIKFFCLNCRERLATNDALDYYRVLRFYGTKHDYRARRQPKE